MRKRSKVLTPASKSAPARPRRAAGRRLHPRLLAGSEPRRVPAVRDRAEVLRRPAGHRRDRPRVQAGPPRLFVDQRPEAGQERPRASRSCRRPRASCPTPPRATPTSAAKSSAGSTKMSRIGKRTIAVPKGVTVTLDGQTVTVKGPKGERSWTVAEEIEVKQDDDEPEPGHPRGQPRARAPCGACRAPWSTTWSSASPGLRARASNWSASVIAPR